MDANTSSYSVLSTIAADEETKHMNLSLSSESTYSSSEEVISVISYPDPVFLPDNELSSQAAPSSVPDSGYLGIARASSSPSLSSGIFDLEGHAIPLQYLSQSGHYLQLDTSHFDHYGGFQSDQMLFSPPKRNEDVTEQFLTSYASYGRIEEDELSVSSRNVSYRPDVSTVAKVLPHSEYVAMNSGGSSISSGADDVQDGISNKRVSYQRVC